MIAVVNARPVMRPKMLLYRKNEKSPRYAGIVAELNKIISAMLATASRGVFSNDFLEASNSEDLFFTISATITGLRTPRKSTNGKTAMLI